jgi:hypothetical protein
VEPFRQRGEIGEELEEEGSGVRGGSSGGIGVPKLCRFHNYAKSQSIHQIIFTGWGLQWRSCVMLSGEQELFLPDLDSNAGTDPPELGGAG